MANKFEAKKIPFILSDKVLATMCKLYHLEPTVMEKANALGLLNVEYIRDIMIRKEYDELTKGLKYMETIQKSYRYGEIVRAIAKAYNCEIADVNAVLKNKNNKNAKFCKRCGKRITSRQAFRTDDLCSECMADTLEI